MGKSNNEDVTLAEFISLFDKRAIEEGRVSFNVYAPLDRSGKWILYCNKGDTAKGLVDFIKNDDCLHDMIIRGEEDVWIEDLYRDNRGKPCVRINIEVGDYEEESDSEK